jgi:hypothetical protein
MLSWKCYGEKVGALLVHFSISQVLQFVSLLLSCTLEMVGEKQSALAINFFSRTVIFQYSR